MWLVRRILRAASTDHNLSDHIKINPDPLGLVSKKLCVIRPRQVLDDR